MDRFYTCFFTGHRNIPENKRDMLEHILDQKIAELIEYRGVDNFICGGALGFDTMSAEAVIRAKKKYPHIKLYLYLPCYNQSALWSNKDQLIWQEMLKRVDNYKYISEENYYDGCMQKRNQKMADDAVYGIAYCLRSRSGTGMTMRNAASRGCIVENIADEIYN